MACPLWASPGLLFHAIRFFEHFSVFPNFLQQVDTTNESQLATNDLLYKKYRSANDLLDRIKFKHCMFFTCTAPAQVPNPNPTPFDVWTRKGVSKRPGNIRFRFLVQSKREVSKIRKKCKISYCGRSHRYCWLWQLPQGAKWSTNKKIARWTGLPEGWYTEASLARAKPCVHSEESWQDWDVHSKACDETGR